MIRVQLMCAASREGTDRIGVLDADVRSMMIMTPSVASRKCKRLQGGEFLVVRNLLRNAEYSKHGVELYWTYFQKLEVARLGLNFFETIFLGKELNLQLYPLEGCVVFCWLTLVLGVALYFPMYADVRNSDDVVHCSVWKTAETDEACFAFDACAAFAETKCEESDGCAWGQCEKSHRSAYLDALEDTAWALQHVIPRDLRSVPSVSSYV